MSKAAELAKSGDTLTNQPSGRKNIVTNGAMQVAQRSTSETGLGAAAGYFTLDRYKIETASSAGRLTMTQTADGPSGFANCLKLDCTTADTSIHADEYLFLRQKFEGQDLQQLKKGTSDAESVTVSFYVKGDQAATYVCELKDNDNSRNNTQAFAVTTSWNRIELTFAADTTGALDDDNASSFEINIWLHAGSGYTGGTFASNTWASVTNANRYAGSRTSFYDSTDREFFLTGVQLEIGSQATNFEHRSFGEELALCQRYFEVLGRGPDSYTMTEPNMPVKIAASTTFVQGHAYKTMKRAAPTVVLYSRNNNSGKVSTSVSGADEGNNWTITGGGVNGFHIAQRDAGTHAAGEGLEYGFEADAEL